MGELQWKYTVRLTFKDTERTAVEFTLSDYPSDAMIKRMAEDNGADYVQVIKQGEISYG